MHAAAGGRASMARQTAATEADAVLLQRRVALHPTASTADMSLLVKPGGDGRPSFAVSLTLNSRSWRSCAALVLLGGADGPSKHKPNQ